MTYPGKLYGGPDTRPRRRETTHDQELYMGRLLYHPAERHTWRKDAQTGHAWCVFCLRHKTARMALECQGEESKEENR